MAFALTSTTGAGTVSVAANSRNVTGSGAGFTSALIGRIFFVGSQWGIVASVTDTATLSLDRLFLNAVSGAAWGHAATNARITQSGTDTSLAALASVPGVTTTTRGTGNSAKAIYDLNALCLNITGTLTHDPDVECIIGTAVANPGFNLINTTLSNLLITVSSGGVYNFGKTSTVNGVVRYSTGLGIASTGVSADPFSTAWLEVKSGGTFNWRGGLIEKAACEYIRSGATVAVLSGSLYNKGASDLQFRVEGVDATAAALISISGLTLGGITNACRMWTAFGYASISLVPNFTNYQFNAAGTNPGSTLTGSIYRYKYGATINGVTLSGSIAARLTSAGIVYLVTKDLAPGETVWSLDSNALTAAIAAKVEAMPESVWSYDNRTLNGALFK